MCLIMWADMFQNIFHSKGYTILLLLLLLYHHLLGPFIIVVVLYCYDVFYLSPTHSLVYFLAIFFSLPAKFKPNIKQKCFVAF